MDKKISELDLVSTLNVNDVLPIVNEGSTKKVKISQLVVTNLSYTPSVSSGQVVSDNGSAATVPLADSVNAGLFSPTEKTKLAGIATGAEVNVNADWNATTGDALILNKPTILSPEFFIPYVGATANLNMGEYAATMGQLTLDTTPTQIAVVGTTQWNDSLGTSQTTLKGGNVILKNGMDLLARIVNKVTPNTTLTKENYQAVRVSGATGQRLSVELAQANLDNNSVDTIGLVCENISTNQEGFIITMGQLLNINTTGSLQGETWVDGDVLYLSPTTAGAITNVKPNGSNGHIVVIGYVEYTHINNGKIYVKIMNGWELDELHNVYITSEANEDFLQYESATQLWKNKQLTGTLIRSKLGITTLSGSNTGDQDLSSLAPKASPTFTGIVTTPAIIVSSETANTIASFDASKNVKSLATTTYPSLTELSYGKGVTSAIQTQIDSKVTTPVWTDYTTTQVGWSTTSTLLTRYFLVGKMVTVYFRAIGNSNSTTTTITLPFNNNGTSNISILTAGLNNNGAVIANISIATGTNVLSATYFSAIGALSSFTASGIKQIAGTITYEIP